MDMLNKLKNAVTNVLPGNPLTRDFEVLDHVASGGSKCSWKIYNAVKKTTKEAASVFVFEKKSIDKVSRADKEIILDSLRKGVSQLTRLRHPKVLSVIHPLEESRETLAFGTEPVFASVANVLGCTDNLPNPKPKLLQEFKLYEVEIKYGLLQISEGLTFLHNDVKMLHRNLCPESIFINKNGAWKLAGFDFCVPSSNPPDQASFFPFNEWDPELPPMTQPCLEYLAPEYGLTLTSSLASDMFSMGVLFYAIFNDGKPIFQCHDQWSTFVRKSEELKRPQASLLSNIPEEVRNHVKMLLNVEPTVRPDPHQFCKIPFFEDVGSMTLLYMDSLFQRDNLQKSQFFKGLPKIISKMPKRVSLQRILPALYKECVNKDMIPFVLPNVLMIADQCTDKEYITDIFPQLKPMFKIKEPIQILLIFMQHMSLLLKKTPQGDIRDRVLPMVYTALEADSPQIQELCLNIIPTFASMVDGSSMRNAIIPRIKKICLATSSLAVRVNALLCLGKLLEHVDKWVVLDDILPLLPQVPSKEPAVLMSLLGIYKISMDHKKLGITKEIIATKVLPFIIPLCIDNSLNLNQFNAYITTVKEMVGKMESEQRTKLEQLNSMQQEQKTIKFNNLPSEDDKNLVPVGNSQPTTMMDKFLSGFGLMDTFKTNENGMATPSGGDATNKSNVTADPKLPGQPAQNLTLEEKQVLAKRQEQQQVYKATKPIHPKQMNSPGEKPKARDLTSSLMNSNLSGLQKSNNTLSSNANSTYVQPISQTANNTQYFPTPNRTASTNFSQKTQKPDLSAFDSLLNTSSNQPKSSLTSMASSNIQSNNAIRPNMGNMNSGFMPNNQSAMNNASGFGAMQGARMPYNQGMMGGSQGMMGGNQGMMGGSQGTMGGNQGMMGGSQGMMGGNQGTMGGSQGMMGGNQGMMAMNQGMMGSNPRMVGNPQQMSFMQQTQPMVPKNTGQSGNKPVTDDFADIFG